MTGYIKLETIGKMGEMISHLEQQNEQLQKKLDVAVKALKAYTKINWAYEDVYNNYSLGSGGWCHAEEALKEIDLVGTSAKEEG